MRSLAGNLRKLPSLNSAHKPKFGTLKGAATQTKAASAACNDQRFQPAQAGFVCLGATSVACNDQRFQPAQAGFVCIGATSVACNDWRFQPAQAGFVCLGATSVVQHKASNQPRWVSISRDRVERSPSACISTYRSQSAISNLKSQI